MKVSGFKAYDVDDYIAEIYDQTETQKEDVRLLRELIGESAKLRILEPFCGNGRILIPLAQDGHELVGMDKSKPMLDSARKKIERLPDDVRRRIRLMEADVTRDEWPTGFDLVILGGNCLYELATSEEQESCIRSASRSLVPGGYLYLDNNHMEGALDESWRHPGAREGFPTGICDDGTRIESTTETIWYDASARLVRFRRSTRVALPGGRIVEKEYVQQKHPVSTIEVQAWLNTHGFVIEQLYGDRAGNPYTETSERAIFWARKT